MADAMVEVQGLTKVFGTTLALDAVDLHVDPGEVMALLGPNGAGKTTLLKLLATAIKPTAGGGRVLGLDLLKGRDGIRRRIGMISHNHHLYEDLTAEWSIRCPRRSSTTWERTCASRSMPCRS